MNVVSKLPSIVGICGPARAGKDTIASVLVDKFGYQKDSFAAPLRTFLANILGITLEQLEVVKDFPSDALGGHTPRFAMQTLGTEWGRKMLAEDLWINFLIRRSTGLRMVVPDIRFQNEAEAIVKAGGAIIKVIRPGVEIVESTHVSERGIPDKFVDHFVLNDKTEQDLKDRVVDLIHCFYE